MAWYNANWGFRKKITIDKDKVNATLSNFPVLISFTTDNDIKDEARADGFDILFTSSDGTTKLKHEIERYTTGTGELKAWVKIPSLPHDADTDIYIYYGNAGAANQEDVNNTWDANFELVKHLKDLTTSTTEDSTSNGFDGTKKAANEPIVATDGQMGNCQNFDGANDYINTTTSSTLNPASITVSAWVKPTNITATDQIAIRARGASTYDGWAFELTTGYLWTLVDGGTGGKIKKSNEQVTAGTWNYVTWTYTGGVHKLYIDGTECTYSSTMTANPQGQAAEDFVIGSGDLSGAGWENRDFLGKIDELRVSSTARAATWISTEYNNQDSPATFYALGAEEQEYATAPTNIVLAVGSVDPVGGVTNVAIPAPGDTDNTGAVTGWVTATADKIKFTVTDGGAATSAITIGGGAYTSGNNYTIPSTANLTVIVTTSEAGKTNAVRTFTITVAAAPPAFDVDVTYLPIIEATIDAAITAARTGANNKYFNVPIVNDMQIMFIHITQ